MSLEGTTSHGLLDCSPAQLMGPDEKRLASKLLRELNRHQKRLGSDDQKLARERKGYEYVQAERDAIGRQLSALAFDVLGRELGLQRYMVVRVDDGRGLHTVQAIDLDLSCYLGPWDMRWDISGRGMRKNGTLGSTWKSIRLTQARIERRRLDGTWEPLVPRTSRVPA